MFLHPFLYKVKEAGTCDSSFLTPCFSPDYRFNSTEIKMYFPLKNYPSYTVHIFWFIFRFPLSITLILPLKVLLVCP